MPDDDLRAFAARLPKAELHVHLEGCVGADDAEAQRRPGAAGQPPAR